MLAGDGGLRGLHVRRERLWPPCLAQNLATGKSEGRRGKASRQARWLRTAEGDPAYGEHEAADWRVREVGREGGLRLGIVQAAGAWRSGTRGGGRGSAEWGPLQPPAQEAEAVEGADILAELKAKGNPGSRRGRGSRAATGSDPKEMGHLTGMGAHGRNHPRRPRRILTALARMSQCFLCGARLLPVRPTLCPPPPPSLHAAINAGRGLGYFRRNVRGLPLPGLRRGGPAVISFVCGGLS